MKRAHPFLMTRASSPNLASTSRRLPVAVAVTALLVPTVPLAQVQTREATLALGRQGQVPANAAAAVVAARATDSDRDGTPEPLGARASGTEHAAPTGGGPMLTVIFAGPNRTFDTTRASLAPPGCTAARDDYVVVRDLDTTLLTAGVSLSRPPVEPV
jgi:hypothetical protein